MTRKLTATDTLKTANGPGKRSASTFFNHQQQSTFFSHQSADNHTDSFFQGPSTDGGHLQPRSTQIDNVLNDQLQLMSEEETEIQTPVMEHDGLQAQAGAEDEETIQPQVAERNLTGLSRKADSESNERVDLVSQLSTNKAQGQVMDSISRQSMERSFQADFGEVRIHTDQKAIQMNRLLGAQAFAYGSHIYFNEHRYQPHTPAGQHLLAHELTHTLQQGGAKLKKQEIDSEAEVSTATDARIFTKPSVFWVVENEHNPTAKVKTPNRAVFAREAVTIEQMAHAIYANPEPMIDSFSTLNSVAPQESIPPYTRIKIPYVNVKPTGWAQQGFWYSMYFSGQARNPFLILESMGLSSTSGFGARYELIQEQLKMDLPMMIFQIQMGLETQFIGLLRKYADERFTEYPDRYPQGGQYMDKIFRHLRGKMKKIRKLGVSQITSYYDIVFNHFARADEVRSIRDIYSRMFRGDDGIKEVSYGVVFLEEAFEKALRVAGVPRADIMNFLNKAGDALSEIIAHPGRFLSNLFAAFNLGFNQFKAKVGEYLTTGLLDWVMSKVGMEDVDVPKDSSVGSILTMVLQALKITPGDLENIVAEVIGQENVHRVRKVWGIVKTFIKNGIGGLVDQLVEYAGDLKQQLVRNLKHWVITKLVQRAVTEVVKMFIPGGNLVAIVKKIYNLIQFVRQRLQEIAELFKAIGESVLSIVKGENGPAVEKIHGVLKSGLYLALELLGRLVNIKFIDGVANAINGLREKVRGAIKKFVQKIAMGGKEALGKVRGWLGINKRFKDVNGEGHRLFTREKAGKHTIMVASNGPQPVRSFLVSLVLDNNAYLVRSRNSVQLLLEETDNLIAFLASPPTGATDGEIQAAIESVESNSQTISKELAQLMAYTGPNQSVAQTTMPSYDGLIGNYWGRGMRVQIIKDPPPGGSRTSSSHTHTSWDALRKRKDGGRTYYVKGHLLNNFLGGPGRNWNNLTPMTQSVNTLFDRYSENYLKNKLGIHTGTSADRDRLEVGLLFIYTVIPAYGRVVNQSLIDRINNVPIGPNSIGGSPPSQLALEDRNTLLQIVENERFVPTEIYYNILAQNPVTDKEIGRFSIRDRRIPNTINQTTYIIDNGTFTF